MQHSQDSTNDSVDFFSKTFWTKFLSKFLSVAYLQARLIPWCQQYFFFFFKSIYDDFCFISQGLTE